MSIFRLFVKPVLVFSIALSALQAQAELDTRSPSAGAMAADTLIARPLYFLSSQIGSVLYAVSLPFSLMGKNADQAAETLIVSPLQAGFIRCLGCGKPVYETLQTEEGENKKITHFAMIKGGQSSANFGKKETAVNFGAYLGSHFRLNDLTHYDVMLGYHFMGTFKGSDDKKFHLQMIEINNRFGREILDNVSITGKLGINYWNNDDEFIEPNKEKSIDGFGYLYGLGLEFKLTDSIRLSLEHGHYHLLDYDGEDHMIRSNDLNLMVHF